ncbi:hypothetical protein BYT27DRAFT_7194287 [Phlegmacium glaucopus]|nr:hypothetical protein BYT27DRAFT_7194287 [Phlegmacium glaucopus]
MPVCPQCDNRQFANKEALLQHMKSSSAWHPFCSICDRRFVSETAFDAHMAAKHPPTYDCTVCNRSYHAPFALEDHYRGSPAHPNCGRCGRGFIDAPACEEHHRTAHPKAPCLPCGGRIFYEDALDQHYWDSVNHPSCIPCNSGFKNDTAYAEHVSAVHSELQSGADAVQAHSVLPPIHPKCNECGLEFIDDGARNAHRESAHSPISLQKKTATEAKVDDDFLPFNDQDRGLDCLPSENIPISSTGLDRTLMERRMESPDLRLEMNFASPLKEVKPLFSPTSLPRPGGIIEELWSSRENVQVSATQTSPHKSPDEVPPALPSRSPIWSATSMLHSQQNSTQMIAMNPLRSYTSATHSRSLTESMPRLHAFPQSFSPPPPTRYYDLPSSRILHSPPAPSTSTGFERFTTPLARSMHSPPASSASTSFDTSRFPTRRDGRLFSPPHTSPPPSEFHPRLYPGSVRHAARTMAVNRPSHPLGPPIVFESNWRKLMEAERERDTKTFEDEEQHQSEISTPIAETPVESLHLHSQFQSHSTATSPSLATASSPTSSALAHSPASGLNDPETRPTTASSTHSPSFHGLSYTITPSSECVSPRSPEVASPADLELLPTISPLITTPIDFEISKLDIPEAQKPLPASPVGSLSPVTVVTVLDVKTQDLTDLAISPLSTSSSQSYITSPQEPVDETNLFLKDEDLLTMPPATPSTPVAPSTSLNPLHCRVCRADTCDDITASMCGHIFCNRCITDAVIKTSRCPVCMTPTLLYCLFRLDLAA